MWQSSQTGTVPMPLSFWWFPGSVWGCVSHSHFPATSACVVTWLVPCVSLSFYGFLRIRAPVILFQKWTLLQWDLMWTLPMLSAMTLVPNKEIPLGCWHILIWGGIQLITSSKGRTVPSCVTELSMWCLPSQHIACSQSKKTHWGFSHHHPKVTFFTEHLNTTSLLTFVQPTYFPLTCFRNKPYTMCLNGKRASVVTDLLDPFFKTGAIHTKPLKSCLLFCLPEALKLMFSLWLK